MKKTIKLATAAFCAIGAVAGIGGNTFAADSIEIYMDNVNGTDVCYLLTDNDSYVKCGDTIGSVEPAGMGSADSVCYFLTLKSNGRRKNLHVSSPSNVKLRLNLIVENDVTFDKILANSSDSSISLSVFVNDGKKMTISDSISSNVFTLNNGNVDIKDTNIAELVVTKGTLNISNKNYSLNKITLDGGLLSTNPGNVKDVVINGGTFNALGSFNGDSMIINGGSLTTSGQNYWMGFVVMKTFVMNDGEFTVFGDRKESSYGIYIPNGGTATINGGKIVLSGLYEGIGSTGGRIYFNGGTTLIQNYVKQALNITGLSSKKEQTLVFKEGIGLKEDGSRVFYTKPDDNGKTTIVLYNINNAGHVTIAADDKKVQWVEGYPYNELIGDEYEKDNGKDEEDKKKDEGLILEGSGEAKKDEEKEDGVPTTPDTGLFENNEAFVVAAALTIIPVLGIGGYLAASAKKRAERKVHFKKR